MAKDHYRIIGWNAEIGKHPIWVLKGIRVDHVSEDLWVGEV